MNALVTQPGLVDAAVIYASVSSRFLDNLDHFTRPGRPEVVEALFDRFGTPAESPRFYRELSPRTYFDRITEPVLAHHGTADGTCPPPWARTTQRLMRSAGVESRLRWWPGEDHAFYARWQDSMDATIRFLRSAPRHLTCDRPHDPGVASPCGRGELSTKRQDAVRAWTIFVEHGDAVEALVRPEILSSWTRSEAAINTDVKQAPLADEAEIAASGGTRRCRPRSSGSSPICGALPRTATSSSRSPTPTPGSSGPTAGG